MVLLHTEWYVSVLFKCPIQALWQGFVSSFTVIFFKLAPLETKLYFKELPSNKVKENGALVDGKLLGNKKMTRQQRTSRTAWSYRKLAG